MFAIESRKNCTRENLALQDFAMYLYQKDNENVSRAERYINFSMDIKDGTIAGSATNLFDCMKNAVQFGIPLGVAVKAATCNPAKSIECSQEIGTLAVGARADILLLDQDLNIVKIL